MKRFKSKLIPSLSLVLINIALSIPGRSVLENVHVYDYDPGLRVVFDLDRLSLIEVESDLPAGVVTVRLRDTWLEQGMDDLGTQTNGVVEVVPTDEVLPTHLVLQIRSDRPLMRADHFTLSNVNDLILDLERSQDGSMVNAVSPETTSTQSVAVAVAGVDDTQTTTATPTNDQPDNSIPVMTDTTTAITSTTPVEAVRRVSMDIGYLNIPPDFMLTDMIAPPNDLSSEMATSIAQPTRTQELLNHLERLGDNRPILEIPASDHLLPQINLDATGPNALRDTYQITPPDLEILPIAIADQYRQNVANGDRRANVRLLEDWISANTQAPSTERMAFLLAEHRYWLACEGAQGDAQADGTEDASTDLFRAIDSFRLALRYYPESHWAPLAWMRIYQAHRRMGWAEEALADLESFERANTAYSIGTILIMQADLLRYLGRDSEELATLAKYLECDPNGPQLAEVLVRLGMIYQTRGQRLPAYNAFRRSWRIDSAEIENDPERVTAVVETAIENRDYPWARDLATVSLVAHPTWEGNARLQTLLGRVYLEMGDIDAAIGIFEDILIRYGENPMTLEAMIRLADHGWEDADEGKLRENVNHRAYSDPRWAYERVVHNWPDQEIAQAAELNLGDYLLAHDQPVEALRELAMGLNRWPDSRLRPNYERGIQRALGQSLDDVLARGANLRAMELHGAYSTFLEHLELEPELTWRMARIYAEEGLWNITADLTEELLHGYGGTDAPSLPWEDVFELNVAALRQERRLPEALEIVDQCLEEFPQGKRFVDLMHSRAAILHDLRRWDLTLEAAEKALDLEGTPEQRITALFLRADATKRTLGPELAVPLYIDALRAFQDEGDGNISDALPYEIVFQLGDSLYQTGNWGRALRVYDELIRNYPDAPESPIHHHRRAICLAQMGQVDEAQQELDIVSEIDRSDLWQDVVSDSERDLQWLRDYPEIFSSGGAVN